MLETVASSPTASSKTGKRGAHGSSKTVASAPSAWSTSSTAATLSRLRDSLRRGAGAFVVDSFFGGMARIGRLHPNSRPARHGVEVLADLAYSSSSSRHHLLDIYRPAGATGPLPVVFYAHGGGFRFMSKDTHWMMALAFARRGYLVVNINYRLSPEHRFPAALEDAAEALRWAARHVHHYGGDMSRLVLAGESAGANIATTLAIATSYRRPEPWARALFDVGVCPVAVIPACGILQVSDPGRLKLKGRLGTFLHDRVEEVGLAYLGSAEQRTCSIDLADPVVVLERCSAPDRPLPSFFSFAGTWDPICDDTRRLHAALERLGATSEVRFYRGEPHAFHAMIWRENARKVWRETFKFLEAQLAR